MIKTLVVDDSPTLRHLLKTILESDPELTVIGEASNGDEAFRMAARLKPDVITMDARMPRSNGFEATSRIMAEYPCPIVMVTGSFSDRELKVSTKALDHGALMVLAKPSGLPGKDPRAKELITTIKAMSEVRVVRRRWYNTKPVVQERVAAPDRKMNRDFKILCIGASTGGPPVIKKILSDMDPAATPPVLMVQHISEGFADSMAKWLDQTTAFNVKSGQDNEIVQPGWAYLAPTGKHMKITRHLRISLTDDPPLRGLKPSVDLLFKSAAEAFGPKVLAVLLTGMGADGAQGLRDIRLAGGYTLAQDRASSAVYGMPAEAVRMQAAIEQAGADELGRRMTALLNSKESGRAAKT